MLRNARPNISFVFLAVIGLVGLFGQVAILHNSLVHSYPFKMMNTPPAEFYSSVGDWGYYISIAAGVAGLALSIGLKRYLTAVVPVILGPLCYWLTFETAHLAQGFSHEDMTGHNFEGYTGYSARYEFGYEALLLMFIGAVIAAVAGFIITRIAGSEPDRLA
jgi:hypothetical protein